jgi:amino acid transporter
VDAAVSPSGTGLLYVGSSARLSFGMARNRYVPAIFEFMSDRRVPLISVAFAFILGLIFFFPFPTWRSLIGLVTGATVLSYGLQPLALSALRRQLPNQERPYRMPLAAALSPAAFVVANLIILWTGWDTNKKLGVAILVGFVILWATSLFARPERKPALDMKGALWVAPYLVGLGVISYIGAKDYDGTSLGLLPFGWDVLVMAVFSLVIYYFALSLRLSAQEAEKNATELGAAGEAEPEMASTA